MHRGDQRAFEDGLAFQRLRFWEVSRWFPAGFSRFWEPSRRFLDRFFPFTFFCFPVTFSFSSSFSSSFIFWGILKKKFKMFWLKISELYKKCSSFQKIILKLEKRFVYSTFVPVLNNVRNIFVPNFKKKIKISKNVPFFKKNSNIPEKIVVLNLFRFFKECS